MIKDAENKAVQGDEQKDICKGKVLTFEDVYGASKGDIAKEKAKFLKKKKEAEARKSKVWRKLGEL